jgi:small-conductance mechanosensitive channel
LNFSLYLKEKNSKSFKIEKNIEKLSSNLIDKNEINNYLSSFLLSLEKKYLGQIKTIAGSSKEEIKDVLLKFWNFINKPIFNINQTDISIFKIVLSIIIFTIGFFIGAFYKRKINNLTANRTLTPSTKTIIVNMGYYLIITIAFFVSLNTLGIKLSSIALVAGALSVGIGFGLQNIVSNFVSGLILMFERSIKIGDFIELDDNIRGYVTDIRMRSTTINTNDNIDIIVPNQSFIQNNVINWTMSDNIRRFLIPFGVAYGSNAHKVIDVVKKAVLNSHLKKYIIDTKTKESKVIMTEMADSSVNFELLIWVRGELMKKPKRTKSEFLIIIYDALYANNIEIPFPQQDIHIRSIDTNCNLYGKVD